MKQTAVEWLVSKLNPYGLSESQILIFEQAIEMEKEQIIDSWNKRCYYGGVSQTWNIETKNGEQYYNETFKNK
jgi:hypothetical protein